jgi:carbonic anhydrase
MQVRRVAATPIVEGAWQKETPLQVHGWIYGIEDGLLRDLGVSIGSLDERERLPSIDQRAVHPNQPLTGVHLQVIDAFGDAGH